MAVTVTAASVAGNQPSAPLFVDRISVAFDDSYADGGEVLGLATILPGKTILGAIAVDGQQGYVFQYVRATDKLQAFYLQTTPTEDPMDQVAGAVDLVALTAVELLVFSY